MIWFEIISSVGSLATAGAFWVSFRMWRQERDRLAIERLKQETDAIEEQARQVDAWASSDVRFSQPEANGEFHHRREIVVTVSNTSKHAIRDVGVEVRSRYQVETNQSGAVLQYAGAAVVPPNEPGKFFVMPAPFILDLGVSPWDVPPESDAEVSLRFTDIRGRRWVRDQRGTLINIPLQE